MSAELFLSSAPILPAVAATIPVRRNASTLARFRQPAGALLLLVAAVLLAYAPALGGQFLWDDGFLVKGNPLIRSPLFVLEIFRQTLFNGDSNFYRPAQTLTYLADYWCWGLEPFGYHLTNTVIHALNGFLLFLLLRRVLPAVVPAADAADDTAPRPATDWTALGVALLWALHPVHSAAVAYISGRADSLAMCFCLSAWLGCERALASDRPWTRAAWAAGAFVALLLGLCSKEIAFVWLVLFTVWLFALRPERTPAARRFAAGKLAVVAGGLAALGLYLCLRHLPPPPPTPPPAPHMPARGLLMLRALGDYGRLMLFPHRLFMERQVFAAPGLANAESPFFYNALAVGGGLVLAAFAAGAWLPGRGRTLRRVGAGWFLIGFLPISNLFSLNASVAEHWLYLPSIGFLLFLAGVALDAPWQRVPAAALLAALLLAVGALGARTWMRTHDWLDRVTFYHQTIRDGGDSPRAREGLATAFIERAQQESERGDHAAAARDRAGAAALLREIVAHYPTALAARVNLATCLLRGGGDPAEPRAMLEKVAADLLASNDVRGGPREVSVTIRSLDKLEPGAPAWTERRRALLDRASARFPGAWELVQIHMADCEEAGRPADALALAEGYAEAHWWHAPARMAVGRLQGILGRTDEALAAWRQAARFDVYDTGAPDAAAALCVAQGRLDEALEFQREAVRRQPESLRQHLLLAEILARGGHGAEAVRERETAARLAGTGEG